MKKDIRYQCEICERYYASEVGAFECEQQGRQDLLPVGLIFGRPQSKKDHLDRNLTFCVADSWNDKHLRACAMWACRDNGAGDTLGRDLCGPGPYGQLPGKYQVPDRSHPTFVRMVAWLKKNKPEVRITVWDGTKPVSLRKTEKE